MNNDFHDDYRVVDRCVKAAKIQLLKTLQTETHLTINTLLGSIATHIEELEKEDADVKAI